MDNNEKYSQDNNNKDIINEMNKFLKGIYMGIISLKDYYEKAHAMPIKKDIESIINSFKGHEEAIIRKIQQLGGEPTDSIGLTGLMGEVFQKIKLIPADEDKEIVQQAVKAMEMGMKNANKFLKEHDYFENDLKDTISGVIKDYDNNLRKLKEWL